MLEEIEDESISDLPTTSRAKPLFNPYQNHRPLPSHITPQLSPTAPSSTTILPDQPQECRICLQASDTPENKLLSPCNCTGTVRLIHDKCLRQWVLNIFKKKTRKQQVKLIEEGVQCQLCKSKIGLSFRQDYACCLIAPFCRKFKERPLVFILYTIVLLIVIGTDSYLGYQLSNGQIDFNRDTVLGAILATAALFLLVVAVMVVHACSKDYLFEKQWVFDGYRKSKPAGRLRHVPIMPVDIDQ